MSDEVLKGEIIEVTLEHLALSGSLIQPSPADKTKLLRFLELLMSSWVNDSLNLGYKLSEYGIDGDASEDSGLRKDDVLAVSTNLAVMSAPTFGVMPHPTIERLADQTKRALHNNVEVIQPKPYGLPMGSANGRYLFSDQPSDVITTENHSVLTDNGKNLEV